MVMTKQEFFARGNELFFWDDPKAIAAYCRETAPEECAHILRVADEVCRNYFLFDLDHDLERTWEPVVFEEGGEVDWEYRPGNDPEFSFQFNRHRFFICLGQAYQFSGREAYAAHFVRLLMSWIRREKRTPETEKTVWRSLEAGIRGEFWVKAIRYFQDSPSVTDEVIDAFYQCLKEHAEYLISVHSPYRYISNWGVLENHGLFEIGIAMAEEELRARYTSIALEHLEAEARIQIMGDGVQWEQSPMYHNEVLHCYEDVLILAERNQIDVPDTIVQAVRRMAYANLAWTKPNGHVFLQGDSDDMDFRGYTGIAAWLYEDPVLRFGGHDRLDFESVWDLGIAAAREYEQMERREPSFTSAALEDSGNYYLRSGWEETADLLHFHCGTMGAGHGHSDKLHVDLTVNGEDVLTDAGRCTYVVEEGRFAFKDPTAHNTITVDDAFFTICQDSWECSKLCQPVKQQFRLAEGCGFVQGGHLGYLDQRGGVFLNRKIVSLAPRLWIVMDEMYTGDTHSYQQYWNFSETGQAKLEKEGNQVLFTGGQAQARFFFLTPGISVRHYRSRISRHYNRSEERDSVQVSLEGEGFASLLTVIQGGPRGGLAPLTAERIPVKSALKGSLYGPEQAEALRLVTEETEYVVILCHQEVNSPTDLEEADGCLGYGSVIVFDKRRGKLAGQVLCY